MNAPTFELHLGDCLESLRDMADESIDLIATDPPYGMKYRSGWREEKFDAIAGDEDPDLFVKVLPELYRVLKSDRHCYIFCSWHQVDVFLAQTKKLFTIKNLIVWNKNNHGSGDLKGAYAPKHELIIFAHKGRRELKRRIPDVMDFKRVAGQSMVHPTEKPVELMRALVANSAAPGEVVLDPFMGSGSTGVAAVTDGISFIGCELSPEYLAIAQSRIGQALYGDLA